MQIISVYYRLGFYIWKELKSKNSEDINNNQIDNYYRIDPWDDLENSIKDILYCLERKI